MTVSMLIQTTEQNRVRLPTHLSLGWEAAVFGTPREKTLQRGWKENAYPLPHFPKDVSCLLSTFIKHKQNPNQDIENCG